MAFATSKYTHKYAHYISKKDVICMKEWRKRSIEYKMWKFTHAVTINILAFLLSQKQIKAWNKQDTHYIEIKGSFTFQECNHASSKEYLPTNTLGEVYGFLKNNFFKQF